MKVSEKNAIELSKLQNRIKEGNLYFNGKPMNESYLPETILGCKHYIKLMDERYGWLF